MPDVGGLVSYSCRVEECCAAPVKTFYARLNSVDELAFLREAGGAKLVFAEVSADRTSVYSFFRATGRFPVEYLAEEGVLRSNIVLVNPFWVTSWELKIIADLGIPVLISASDMTSSGSVFPLQAAVRHGVLVAPISGHRGLGPVLEAILLRRVAVGKTAITEDHLLEANSKVLGSFFGCRSCQAIIETEDSLYAELRDQGLPDLTALLVTHPRITGVACTQPPR